MPAKFDSPLIDSNRHGRFLIKKFLVGESRADLHQIWKSEQHFIESLRVNFGKYKERCLVSPKQLAWLIEILIRHGLDPNICHVCGGSGLRIPTSKYNRTFSRMQEDLYAHPCPDCRPEDYQKWKADH